MLRDAMVITLINLTVQHYKDKLNEEKTNTCYLKDGTTIKQKVIADGEVDRPTAWEGSRRPPRQEYRMANLEDEHRHGQGVRKRWRENGRKFMFARAKRSQTKGKKPAKKIRNFTSEAYLNLQKATLCPS